MDAHQFDDLVKTFASPSRRRLLRGVMAASLSGLGLLRHSEVEATHFECRHVGVRCKSKDQCCSGICRGKRKKCRAHHTGSCKTTQDTCAAGENLPENECGISNDGVTPCYCHVTTGGAPFCAQSWTCGACEKDSEAFAGALPGAACVDCPACTGASNPDGTLYAMPCDNPYH